MKDQYYNICFMMYIEYFIFTSNMRGGWKKKEETISNIRSVFIKASKIIYTIIVFQLSPFIINLLTYVVQFVMYFLKLKNN